MDELDDNAVRLKRSLEEALAHVEGRPTGVRVSHIDRTGPDVRAVRAKLGITQPQMAALLGASPSGYRKWEQGVRRPSGAVLTLLRIADRNPRAVLDAVGDVPLGRPGKSNLRAAG